MLTPGSCRTTFATNLRHSRERGPSVAERGASDRWPAGPEACPPGGAGRGCGRAVAGGTRLAARSHCVLRGVLDGLPLLERHRARLPGDGVAPAGDRRAVGPLAAAH